MKIYKTYTDKMKEEKFLFEALEIDLKEKQIISFVGGGGKTSSIYRLATEFSNIGKKVIVTTTTHIEFPSGDYEISNNINNMKLKLKEKNILTVGLKYNDFKISSLEFEDIEKLIDICDILLIEADGSKKLPIKVPANHEPVIFNKSNLVIGLCGIDGLDKKIKDVCHRVEMAEKVLNKNDGEKLSIDDIVMILSSKDGQMKNLYDNENKLQYKYKVIINKVDNEILKEKAFEIISKLRDKKIKAIATSYKTKEREGENTVSSY